MPFVLLLDPSTRRPLYTQNGIDSTKAWHCIGGTCPDLFALRSQSFLPRLKPSTSDCSNPWHFAFLLTQNISTVTKLCPRRCCATSKVQPESTEKTLVRYSKNSAGKRNETNKDANSKTACWCLLRTLWPAWWAAFRTPLQCVVRWSKLLTL